MFSRKVLVLLSIALMIAVMLSLVAFSEDETEATDNIDMNHEAADAVELQRLINSSLPGMNIKLTGDIKLKGLGYINIEGKTVVIDLNGHVIDAGRKEWAENGYAIRVCKGSTLTIKDSTDNGVITGGFASYGGGIYIIEGGTVYIYGGTIKNNKASVGGGGIYNAGTLNIMGGDIYLNEAGSLGGGVYSTGTLNMTDGNISSNKSGSDGGGIYSSGVTKIDGGVIKLNVAESSGGGLRVYGGKTTINGGKFVDNVATKEHGGAIYAGNKSTLNLWGGRMTGNLAGKTAGGILFTTACTLNVKGAPIVDNNTAPTGNNIMMRDGTIINIVGTLDSKARLDVEANNYTKPITNGYSRFGNPSWAFIHGLDNSDIEPYQNELWFKNKNVVHVKSWGKLQDAIDNASFRQIIVLDKDISSGSKTRIMVEDGKNVIIDLNGHTMKRETTTDYMKKHGYRTNGHAIQVSDKGTVLTIRDSAGGGTITGGEAQNGGGINIGQNATCIIEGGTITRNYAIDGGGIMVRGTLIMTGGEVLANRAEDTGGGIFITKTGKAYLSNCSIDTNIADDDAAGIYLKEDGFLEADNVKIVGNASVDHGAGVFLRNGAKFTNCTFERNSSGYGSDGGAIFFGADDEKLELTNCYFYDNVSYLDGGAIMLSDGKIVITGCKFESNKCKNGKGLGGAICVAADEELVIKNSEFISNKTSRSDGGALYLNSDSKATIENTRFYKNKADGYGGAIYIELDVELTVSNCVFEKNYASESGGAIYSDEGIITIKNGSQFISNGADESGGALRILDGKCTIKSSSEYGPIIFSKNYTEDEHGGAIYLGNDATLKISDCQMTDNKAATEGGAILVSSSDIEISGKVIIKDNTASKGPGISLRDNIKLKVTGSLTGSRIFVTYGKETGVFTKNYEKYNSNLDPGNVFFSTDDLSAVLKSGEASFIPGEVISLEGEFVPWYSQIRDSEYVTGRNWMSALSGERYLYEINIPASANSATKKTQNSFDNKSQDKYIYEQLLDGIRMLDISVTNYGLKDKGGIGDSVMDDGKNLWLTSSGGGMGFASYCMDQNGNALSLDKTLGWIKDFLKKHPTETVILKVKPYEFLYEDVAVKRLASAVAALSKQINPTTGESYLYYEGNNPNGVFTEYPMLKDCRGKIVIMSEEEDANVVGGMCLERLGSELFLDNPITETFDHISGFLITEMDIFLLYNLDHRIALPTDATHSSTPLAFLGTMHASSSYLYSLMEFAEKINDVVFYDRGFLFFPEGNYFGMFMFDDASAKEAGTIWQSNFFDDLEYCTITVRSGLDEGKYPIQTFRVLRNTEISIPASIYDYDQKKNNNYLVGWSVSTGGGAGYLHPGETYNVTEDVVFRGSWTSSVQTPIYVEWLDGDNYDKLRPTELTIKVKDKNLKATESGFWMTATGGVFTAEDITPVWERIGEDTAGKYRYTVEGQIGSGFTIKLIHTPDAYCHFFNKVSWDADMDYEPDEVTVCLFADGELTKTTKVTKRLYWFWSFVFQPMFKDGRAIDYTVAQIPVADWDTYVEGYSILNIYHKDEDQIKYIMIWNDGDAQNRPQNVTVTFRPDGTGEGIQQTVEVKPDYNCWQIGSIDVSEVEVTESAILSISYIREYHSTVEKKGDAYVITITPNGDSIITVMQKINDIGEVSLTQECRERISDAREHYNSLREIQKVFVLNYNKLLEAERTYDALQRGEGAVNYVVKLINDIGTVVFTNDCIEKVQEARDEYDALPDNKKSQVSNYNKLQEAENELRLLNEGKVAVPITIVWNDNGISTRPDKITLTFKPSSTASPQSMILDVIRPPSGSQSCVFEVPKDSVEETATLSVTALEGYIIDVRLEERSYIVVVARDWEGDQVKSVMNMITDIGEVVYSEECDSKISAAREAYDSLNENQRLAVTNYEVLLAAEDRWLEISSGYAAVEVVESKINEIGTVEFTPECKTKIKNARSFYNALTDEFKVKVENIEVLDDAEKEFAYLQENYNAATVVIEMIYAIEKATGPERHDVIEAANEAYLALTDAQKELVTNYDILKEALGEFVAILKYEVVMDGWIYGSSDIPSPKVIKEDGADFTHPEGKPVQYTYTDSEGNPITPTSALSAGTYVVTASYEASAKYPADSRYDTFVVEKIAIDLDDVDVRFDKYTYDGNDRTVTTAVGSLVRGTDYTVSVQQNGTAVVSNVPKNAGIYEVVLTITNLNYILSNGEDSYTAILSIERATNSITSLTIEGWEEGHTPSTPHVSALFGEATVVFTYSASQYGEFTETVPTTAGTWYLKAEIASTDLYTGVVETTPFVISSAEPVKTYIVRFDANNGEGWMADQNFTYDEEKALTTNDFTRVGYVFAGWGLTPEGAYNTRTDRP